MPQTDVLRPAAALEAFAVRLIAALGAADDVAEEVGRHLVGANLAGHDSHGILRIPRYRRLAERGLLDPKARPRVLREGGANVLFDAGLGFGHFSTRVALDAALDLASRYGLGAAAVRQSTHIGRLGEYAELAAARGMIGIVTMGIAGPRAGNVVPFGGSRGFLSTNPWAFGVPAGDGGPFLYDAATSSIAEGKIHYARAARKPLPDGTIVDAAGAPSTDPEDFYAQGALLPVGGLGFGHKGYGFGMAAAMMGALATIGDPAPALPTAAVEAPPAPAPGLSAGVFVLAVDPGTFGDPGAYADLTRATLDAVRAEPPAPGVDAVLAPGDPERIARAERLANGIPIPAATWADLCATAEALGVSLP